MLSVAQPHKTIHANEHYMHVYYTDTKKYWKIPYDKSPIDDRQLYGQRPPIKQKRGEDFTAKQLAAYKLALHGLKEIDPVKAKKLTFRQKTEIETKHELTKLILNTWKQKLISEIVDKFLAQYFPHSKLVKRLTEASDDLLDPSVECEESFASLGVTRYQIALKLVKESILPDIF